jgi:hypothetical protein
MEDQSMGSVPHVKTERVKVWVDVDEKIAYAVRYLNTIPGVRTHASCQGTIGEGGPEPYGPYVEVTWNDDKGRSAIEQHFDLQIDGTNHGTARPPTHSGRSVK